MIVRFPDGLCVNIPGQFSYSPNGVTLELKSVDDVYGGGGGVIVWTYTAYSAAEQLSFMNQIQVGIARGLAYLDLYSLAPLPTNGDVTAPDMFVDYAVSGGGTAVAKNELHTVSIGTAPIAPGGAALAGSFQPDGKIKFYDGVLGEAPCLPCTYVDAQRMLIGCPDLAVGTYSLIYTDSRGSVTKATAVTYS